MTTYADDLRYFDASEFRPESRGGKGLCSHCDEPARWMVSQQTSRVLESKPDRRGHVVRHTLRHALCDEHAERYWWSHEQKRDGRLSRRPAGRVAVVRTGRYRGGDVA